MFQGHEVILTLQILDGGSVCAYAHLPQIMELNGVEPQQVCILWTGVAINI